ncbi:PREDICTED: major royal jelly protein 1 [Ceratosolen solmsi marchali]|uniref:Major royal jelly protein 1 n=1 Tax=Ceratosolen solmsi marchali TaxID=326594 RepID=A0AAJ6YBL3_9HYME|nr:PREDICTED: major royal jelly protein 1 [Ceratosolen solmsi marchali]
MKKFFTNALLSVALSLSTCKGICDRQLLPELSFTIAGHNLDWPCQSTKNIYESMGRYVPRNIIATRVQIYKDEALVAMPRYKSGVPFTLGITSLKSKDFGSRIKPFPCWPMQEEGNCEALQNAVDLFLDTQDILWVLDIGIVNTLEQPIRRCPPKVIAINIKTAKVVKMIDLSQLISSDSRIQYLVVDYAHDGQVLLYISDAATRAIIVYNVNRGSGYRLMLPKMVTIGCARNDVLYLALVRKGSGTSVLYFTYLGSTKLFSIDADNLRKSKTTGSIVDVGLKNNKIVVLGTDNGCAIFFRLKGQSDIFMWNTEAIFRAENFLLVQKGSECRLPTQVIPGYKKLMWVIESNFHDYIQNTVGCSGASVLLHPLVKSYDD